MTIWQFSLQDGKVQIGRKKRLMFTTSGCNEPYKDRYWCPKKKWFRLEPCPFVSRRECNNYSRLSGERLAYL